MKSNLEEDYNMSSHKRIKKKIDSIIIDLKVKQRSKCALNGMSVYLGLFNYLYKISREEICEN